MRIVIASFIVVCTLLSTSQGSAQIEGKFKLGLGVDMLSVASYENDQSSSGDSVIALGPFAPNFYQSMLGVPSTGLDLGYGVSQEVVIGVVMQLGVTEAEDATSIALGFLPHVDYVLSANSSFRPFVGGLAGISLRAGDGFFSDDEMTFATVGLEVGGYGFTGNSLSIGPRLVLTYNRGVSNATENMSVIAAQIQLEIAGWI